MKQPAPRAQRKEQAAAEATLEEAAAPPDPYGSIARDKYAFATALGSQDFDRQPEPQPAAEETPEMDREKWLERYAGSSAISSEEFNYPNGSQESGVAKKLAGASLEAGKKLTGYAASWLNRGSRA